WTRALSNTQIDAVLVRIGIPGLQQQENDGDIVGTTVQYHIDLAVDGGAYSTVMTKTVTEKLSSLYELTHRINLPKASTGWQIRVVRDTDDSTSQMLQNKTQVQAITEVIDARLRYPHTALLYVSFNAKSFNNIPKISCMPKGRIIRIPSNYDPIARTYSGTWDGTFKWGWTNNPAWIWFDVLTEPRFGLGRRVTPEMLDKWEIYRIAQRCDQKVPDGKGGSGTEPRFMFDVYIQSQADAWQVIKDIAAGFNGMTFWGNNMFNVVSDMPADTTKLQILTRASVVGKPVYSSGSEKNRFSSALINFSDPDNHYQDRTTAVMFPELVRQFKFKQTQITAIGCTRESEAQRRGGWAVYSNSLDRIITLQTGLDGFVFVPGTVFAFADERLSGRVYGGRITGYNAGLKAVTIDRGTSAVAGDTLMIRTQGGTVESRVIQAVNGTQLILSTPFTAAPLPNAVFVIDAGQLRLQYFRVTNLKFDDEENTFTITGAEYNASKYDAVDNNARLDTPPISLIPTGLVNQPTNIVVSSYDAVRQGQRVATLTASWDAPVDKNGKPQADVIAYRVQWKRGDNEWVNVPETGLRNIEVPGIFEGDYLVRVRAINSGGASSLWATSALTHLKGRAGEVPKPVGLKASEDVVFGINVTWGFPANTGDTLSTELQYSIAADGSNPMLLASVPYPQKLYQQMGLKAGQIFWYRAQLVDRSGNESGYTEWVRGQASIDVSDITDVILEEIKDSDTFKDLIENAVDSNEKIAGMADDIKQANDELELQAQEIAKNAQDIGQVQTSVNELSSTVGDVSSSLSDLEQTVATADTALGQRIDSISVSMDGMTGGVKNSAIAIIQNGLAQVATRKRLSATVAGNSAQLDRIDEVIVNEKEATARSLLSLQTDVNGNKASINSLNQTFSDYQQATATQINGITATVNGHTSAITTNAQAIANVNGDLSAMYNIKVGVSSNGQYYAAGMGIGVENTPSGMQSQVIFLADRFAVTTAAGNSVALPFVIQNGQTFIRASFIQDGTIENAKIGNYIQSNNYAAGSAGWKLNKAGDAEFNNVTVRGVVYASGGSFTGEIQATSGKFTGTVEATSFVGDVANMYTGSDVSRLNDGVLEKTITYNDTSSAAHRRHICVMANVKGFGGCTINIDGSEKNLPMDGNERLVMHSSPVTSRAVTVKIKVSAQNSMGAYINSPTVIVTRGSGSFSG
ncbi:phage tail tip fiber protein, partial [Escherichia coli]